MSSSSKKPSLYPTPGAASEQHHSAAYYPPPTAPPSFDLGPSPLDAGLSSISTANPSNPSVPSVPSQPPLVSAEPVYSAPPSSSGVHETLPPDYEIVLEIDARVTQVSSTSSTSLLQTPKQGTLRVIQGPIPPSTPEQVNQTPSYHAFISIDDVNIPLLSTCGASRPSKNASAYYVSIPNHSFMIQPHYQTEPELVEALEQLLRWFCQWQTVTDGQPPSALHPSNSTAAAATVSTSSPEGVITTPPTANTGTDLNEQQPNMVNRLSTAGDKGVLFVERMGTALNKRINTALDRRRENIREEDGKNLKLGGKVTSSVLITTRKVVGVGATVASKVTDKISSQVGKAMSGNAVSRSMADAPRGSAKRTVYDNLMAGALAFGRIYVEADRQGKIIIEDAGDRFSEIARKKYGQEAEHAARNVSGIALDGYRISRFPTKLGATSIIRGAFKSKFAQDSHVAVNDDNPNAQNATGKEQTHSHVVQDQQRNIQRHPNSYVTSQQPQQQQQHYIPGQYQTFQPQHPQQQQFHFNDISE